MKNSYKSIVIVCAVFFVLCLTLYTILNPYVRFFRHVENVDLPKTKHLIKLYNNENKQYYNLYLEDNKLISRSLEYPFKTIGQIALERQTISSTYLNWETKYGDGTFEDDLFCILKTPKGNVLECLILDTDKMTASKKWSVPTRASKIIPFEDNSLAFNELTDLVTQSQDGKTVIVYDYQGNLKSSKTFDSEAFLISRDNYFVFLVGQDLITPGDWKKISLPNFIDPKKNNPLSKDRKHFSDGKSIYALDFGTGKIKKNADMEKIRAIGHNLITSDSGLFEVVTDSKFKKVSSDPFESLGGWMDGEITNNSSDLYGYQDNDGYNFMVIKNITTNRLFGLDNIDWFSSEEGLVLTITYTFEEVKGKLLDWFEYDGKLEAITDCGLWEFEIQNTYR